MAVDLDDAQQRVATCSGASLADGFDDPPAAFLRGGGCEWLLIARRRTKFDRAQPEPDGGTGKLGEAWADGESQPLCARARAAHRDSNVPTAAGGEPCFEAQPSYRSRPASLVSEQTVDQQAECMVELGPRCRLGKGKAALDRLARAPWAQRFITTASQPQGPQADAAEAIRDRVGRKRGELAQGQHAKSFKRIDAGGLRHRPGVVNAIGSGAIKKPAQRPDRHLGKKSCRSALGHDDSRPPRSHPRGRLPGAEAVGSGAELRRRPECSLCLRQHRLDASAATDPAVDPVQGRRLEERLAGRRCLDIGTDCLEPPQRFLPDGGCADGVCRDQRQVRTARERLAEAHSDTQTEGLSSAGGLADHLRAAGFGRQRHRPSKQLVSIGQRAAQREAGEKRTDDHDRTYVRINVKAHVRHRAESENPMAFTKSSVAVALALAAALLLGACGGSEGGSSTAAASVPGGADPEKVEVIVAWAEAESSGDHEAAAAYFAIPSLAQNGITVRIENASDAERFSASLPCGAVLEEATEEGEYVIATFRLGEKTNSNACGGGTGQTARTAFLIENGKIVEWRRVADETGRPAPSSST